MARRQFPRWSELRPFLRTNPPVWSARERRLRRALTIEDLREVARRRVPRSVFDYVDGGAGNEAGLRWAREAYAQVEFRPRVLRDVSKVDTSIELFGTRFEQPFLFAPTGFTRLMHHDGEVAVAQAAAEMGIAYALSTMGTTSIEELVRQVPDGVKWFQLYIAPERPRSIDLMRRAEDSGYQALIVTVDSAVPAKRLRDARNGFSIPPTLTMRTFADIAMHPAWWMNVVTTPPLDFTSLADWNLPLAELFPRLLDPSVSLEDLDWVREAWSGPIVVKGVQTVEDAVAIVDAGADAIVLSSHGGRQLDRAAAPLGILPDTVAAVGDRAKVLIDSGVMSGGDVVTALALGADAVLVGRTYLYGLMAGGVDGVRRSGDILAKELHTTMQLLGATSIPALGPEYVHRRDAR
ncbi:MAG: alpha-hydroxy-acid oxidizing enzyme [Micrococcales bacterium 73-13]|nr:MAG: alpha-hydroxy-acid oxidizing enzyme [Micrococcales bacterium 73-13]